MANVTVTMDDKLLNLAKHMAVDSDLSLSAWIAEVIGEKLKNRSTHENFKKKALYYLDNSKPLGAGKFSRNAMYAEMFGDE